MRTFLLFALMGTITLLTISAKSATVKTPIDGKRASSLSFSEQANGSGLTLQPQLHFTGKESAKERFAKIKAYQLARQEVETFSDNDIPLSAPVVPCNTADSLALVDLFNTTDGASWTNKTFWLAQRVTLWYGVDVNASGRVIKVDLSNNNLSGNLPPSIGNMSYLSQLFLSGNHITGSLPSEIGNISELYELILDNNSMTGEIPVSIGAIPYLYWIDLSNNAFSGNFPTEIGSQPDRLLNFFIANNQFTGNVLSSLTNQTYLEKINISGNEFAGELPIEIGNLNYLNEFHIDQNNYTFNNIEPVFSWDNYTRFQTNFSYANQAEVGVADTIEVNAGSLATISIIDYEPGLYDEYQWYHNDDIMEAENNQTLTISNIQRVDAGNYVCLITNTLATELILYTKNVLLNVVGGNSIPIAIASSDQSTVREGILVTLDGSSSFDADNDPLTYTWTAPLGITLSDINAQMPLFTSPNVNTDTTYKFILVVHDGFVYSVPDTVAISIKNNLIPVAIAGNDQSANREGDLITLDGSASSDGDGDPITYNWSAPAGITLNDSTLAVPTFIMPEVNADTSFNIVLVVNDGFEDSAPDTVAISVINNLVAIANAGTDQTVTEGDPVQLSASGSSDGNGDPLTYNWSAPVEIALSDNTASNPTFTAPEVTTDTTFTIVLVVYDDFEYSVSDTVAILVQNAAAVPETLAIENETVGVGQTRCYDAMQTITVAGNSTTVTFQTGSTIEIIAGQRINFLPGFHAQSGSVVHAHISSIFCDPPASFFFAEKGVVIGEDIRPDKAATGIKEVKVYPNPTTGKFTVELTNYNQPVTVSVYSMRGSRVAATTAGNAAEFDMGHLAKGLYMVQVAGDNTVQTKKIMIE